MAKSRFSMVAALATSGAVGLFLSGASCGSSGGGGAAGAGGHAGTGGGGAGGAHDGGGGTGGQGGARDAGMDLAADSAVGSVNFTFNTDMQGFAIDPFASPTNLGAGAGTGDGGAAPTALFDGTIGMPTPGSAHITATFTAFNQVLIVMATYQVGLPLNLTGKVLSAQIKLDGPGTSADGGSGGSSSFSGIVHLYALSTVDGVSFFAAEGPNISLTDNNWHPLTFDMAHPGFAATGFQAAQIVNLGVQFATPSNTAPDAATPAFGSPQSISVHFDSLISN